MWTARGDNAVEEILFRPRPRLQAGVVRLLERGCEDRRRIRTGPCGLKNFLPGVDPHEITGRAVWGDDEYEAHMPDGWKPTRTRKRNPSARRPRRSRTRNYGGGAKTISRHRANRSTWRHFVEKMAEAYRWLCDGVGLRGSGDNGYIYNAWGRRMSVNIGRSYPSRRRSWASRGRGNRD